MIAKPIFALLFFVGTIGLMIFGASWTNSTDLWWQNVLYVLVWIFGIVGIISCIILFTIVDKLAVTLNKIPAIVRTILTFFPLTTALCGPLFSLAGPKDQRELIIFILGIICFVCGLAFSFSYGSLGTLTETLTSTALSSLNIDTTSITSVIGSIGPMIGTLWNSLTSSFNIIQNTQ
ncbi:Uncharacterised protein [Candidatus Tiddalikarchaeum anstoanum]|nr:Uncharacterised protein [Candidatus Tiddalikarchaeum anstoanum]